MVDEIRIYVLVRTDLPAAPAGKLMAQVGHAVLGTYVLNDAVVQHRYMTTSQAKIVLGVESLTDLGLFAVAADELGFPNAIIVDEGRTIFNEPTTTCLGIGPITKEQSALIGLDKLKLYR